MFYLTHDKNFGQIECWMNDDVRPKRLRYVTGYDMYEPTSAFVHSEDLCDDIPTGVHTLNCKLISHREGGHIFRISATVTR